MSEFLPENHVNCRRVGEKFENLASAYLQRKGYLILEKNYRCRFGEIDMIARDGQTYVFIEVKFRTTEKRGHPGEAVNLPKQKIICKCALYYLSKKVRSLDVPCRFDVISILGEKNIQHVVNAFDYVGA